MMATWSALDMRRRAVVAVATLGMFLAILGLARTAGTPRMALLYAGLDQAVAGEVLAAIEARGVAYQVQGDAIRVDAAMRDELRLALAAEGLPAAGGAGYELLDGLSGFGTTSQMFDAAYWRAKEGELARTILGVPGLRAARVHIAQAPAQPFARDRRPTASVTVTAAGSLPPARARAIRHLVAAAVAGLQPEDVVVIDAATGLVPLAEDGAAPASGDTRAADLKRGVERLLAARMGPGRAVVEVSVEVVTDRESVTERRFDPQGRVAISSETEERTNSSTQPGGEVTVASNLPEGDAAAGAQGRSQSAETRERVNFEVSETSRELLRLPGAVRRLTVAVMVDGTTAAGPDGAPAWSPLPEEELSALRDLVASAVGLDPARGDVLTLKSMPFEPAPALGTDASAPLFAPLGPVDPMTLIQLAVLAFVALLLGLFVLRPLLSARTAAPADRPLLALPGAAAPDLPPEGLRVLTGEIDDGGPGPLSGADGDVDPPEDPVERLRRLIEHRRAESVEVLRGWMDADEESR
ncbi:MAG: flagellar M-ring protein FliF [Paracoccaceae bacterium]|nr:MAG: flagellar M-ring protein FliF [Paracoccaceae bacterium]